MNTNAFAIKVNTLGNTTAYICLDHITAIVQSDTSENTCEIRTVGNCCYFTNASADEVYAVIQGLFPMAMADAPEIGFPKPEPTPQPEEDGGLDENGLNPEQSEIVELVNNFSFSRYSNLREALDYIHLCEVTIGNGDGEDYTSPIVNIEIGNDNRPKVSLKDGNTYDIAYFSDADQEKILSGLLSHTKWETMYEWLNEGTNILEYINIFNESQSDKRKYILPNTEVNINAFNLTAGELMKSMVNGNYKKSHAYITVENNELVSTDDPCVYIDCVLLTDWMLENKDYAKEVMPGAIFATVFN